MISNIMLFAVTMALLITLSNGYHNCLDKHRGMWSDKDGQGCHVYSEKGWCGNGSVAENFAVDNFSDSYHFPGDSAETVCCVCGGGDAGEYTTSEIGNFCRQCSMQGVISGRVWNDAHRVNDELPPTYALSWPLGGVPLELFKVVDDVETSVGTTESDMFGLYTFSNLEQGSYRVQANGGDDFALYDQVTGNNPLSVEIATVNAVVLNANIAFHGYCPLFYVQVYGAENEPNAADFEGFYSQLPATLYPETSAPNAPYGGEIFHRAPIYKRIFPTPMYLLFGGNTALTQEPLPGWNFHWEYTFDTWPVLAYHVVAGDLDPAVAPPLFTEYTTWLIYQGTGSGYPNDFFEATIEFTCVADQCGSMP